MHIGLKYAYVHIISVDRYLCVKTEHLLDGKVYLMLFAEVDKNNCKVSSLILCVLQNYEHLDVTVTDWGAQLLKQFYSYLASELLSDI